MTTIVKICKPIMHRTCYPSPFIIYILEEEEENLKCEFSVCLKVLVQGFEVDQETWTPENTPDIMPC